MILPPPANCDKGLGRVPYRLPERRPSGRRALRPLAAPRRRRFSRMSRPHRSGNRMVSYAAVFRGLGCITLLAMLAACGGQSQQTNATQEAARYLAHARSNYTPPGPPEGPWGPYIREATKRYDVPEIWVRSVMRVESGGNQYVGGRLTMSGAGAMGLMRVMPETYQELESRYSLGDDPFDPHDNIMAGAAYLREMYDIYGSPGFLAAYNAGPRRLDDYLSNNRPLPDETRHYVAMIGPNIVGVYPVNHSPAEDYAMNALPINIPPGTRYGRATVQLASTRGGGGRVPVRAPVEYAQAPQPMRAAVQPPPQQYAMITPPVPPPSPQHARFHLIFQAVAAPMPLHHGGPCARTRHD